MTRTVLALAVILASGVACTLALGVALSWISALLPHALDAMRRLGL